MNRLLATIAFTLMAIWGSAQPDIRFTLASITHEELTDNAAATINLRLNQAFNRTNALSDDQFTVFTIEPVIILNDISQTEGMVHEIASIKAELVLTARNIVDSTVYNSATMPLKAAATGGLDAAMKSLASGIKYTDPFFVRFIRNTRKKINDYYAENCAKILQRAQLLADSRKYAEAASYLSAVSDAVPCFEQASAILAEIVPYTSVTPDTVIIERVVERPVERIVEIPVKTDTVAIAKTLGNQIVSPNQQPSAKQCHINVDSEEISFKVLTCKGNATQSRVYILTEIENFNRYKDKAYTQFTKAFDNDGNELTDLHVGGGSTDWRNINMPDGVPVKVEFYISGASSDVMELSFLEIMVRGIKITVRDLAVQW